MPTIVKRLNSVDGFRAISQWLPGEDLEDFTRLNLIYGVNGSGKTTFSDLLRQAGLDEPRKWQVTLTAESSDGETRRVSSRADSLWKQVLVFNESYVAENLEFNAASGPRTTAHLTLGKNAIEHEHRRAELEREIEHARDASSRLAKRSNERESELKNLVKDTATSIGRELGPIGGRYNQRSYNAGTLRPLLDTLMSAELAQGDSDNSLEEDLQVVQQQAMNAVPEPNSPVLQLAHHRTSVQRSLQATPTSITIDELILEPQANRWVQAGISLHETRDSCHFCKGSITEERRAALLGHFDESLSRLQNDLQSEKASIEQQVASLKTFARSLPAAQEIAASKRSIYSNEVASLTEWIGKVESVALEMVKGIEAKLDQLFEPLETELPQIPDQYDLTKLVNPVKEHNRLMAQLEANKASAAKRIEKVRAQEVLAKYRFLVTVVSGLKRRSQDSTKTLKALEEEMRQLSRKRLDPGPIASELTAEICQLLGHASLEFFADGEGYCLLRNRAPASGLSEGERNAIALLHFLKGLKTEGTDLEESIVVIDDPVSSTDQNITIGLSAQIWATVAHGIPCAQLFLLTHNFEVYKLWVNAASNALSRNKARAFEFRTTTRPGANGTERIPRLENLGPSARASRMQSEYHYLFARVAGIVRESSERSDEELLLEASCILPNASRRLLEGFLAFRDPTRLGDISAQIEHVSSAALTSAVRRRVRDFVHAYSHNLEADPTGSPERPEAIVSLRAILNFMDAIDPDHVREMLRAVSIELPLGEGA